MNVIRNILFMFYQSRTYREKNYKSYKCIFICTQLRNVNRIKWCDKIIFISVLLSISCIRENHYSQNIIKCMSQKNKFIVLLQHTYIQSLQKTGCLNLKKYEMFFILLIIKVIFVSYCIINNKHFHNYEYMELCQKGY